MLAALTRAKLITASKIRDAEFGGEPLHRSHFSRFLREIPENFQYIARHADKRQLVKTHLKAFYMALPRDWEVEAVLERITALALLVQSGRDACENKTLQHHFKRERWKVDKRCALCGYEFRSFDDVTLDHMVPVSYGGPDKQANWQLVCKLCNNQKQEYWGVADLSRSHSLRISQTNATFFALSGSQVLENLKITTNPTRYWVLERDDRKCCICATSTTDAQLYVGPREKGFLLVIDNLTPYCTDCAHRNRIPLCKCPSSRHRPGYPSIAS